MKEDQNTTPENTWPQPTDQPVNSPAESPAVKPVEQTQPDWAAPQTDAAPAPESPTPEAPVQPVTGTPVANDAPVSGKPSKKKKGLFIGLIVAAALVLLGGGSALAYNLWYQNPEKVVGDALVNAIKAKSVAMTGAVNVENSDGTTVAVTIDAKSDGAIGEVSATLNYRASEVEITAKGSGHFTAEGDLYVKLDDARELVDSVAQQSGGLVDLTPFDSLITKIDGNWIKIAKDDLGDYSEELKQSQQCYADAAKLASEDKAATEEIATLYKNNKFIIVGESLGSKTINGNGSLGYKISGDRQKARDFATGLKDTQFGKKLIECDASIDFSDIVSDATETNDSTTTDVELWVSRFGHEITEFSVKGSDDSSKGSVVVNPTFNKPLNVETPKDAISLDELRAEIDRITEGYMAQ